MRFWDEVLEKGLCKLAAHLCYTNGFLKQRDKADGPKGADSIPIFVFGNEDGDFAHFSFLHSSGMGVSDLPMCGGIRFE